MSNRKPLPGKFVWFEHVSKDANKAQAFYGEVLGWKTQAFPMGASTYQMIGTGDSPDTMIGGYATPKNDARAHWISYCSVEDVDAAAKAATANGGKVVDPPYDATGVGRMARIADPQGAEICLFKNADGDAPDAQATAGRFFWNELHTTKPEQALAFYEKVLGFGTAHGYGPRRHLSHRVQGRRRSRRRHQPPAARGGPALAALRLRRRCRRGHRARQEERRHHRHGGRGHPGHRALRRRNRPAGRGGRAHEADAAGKVARTHP